MIRSCARRSFDAATIFIALVICCVFLTARIRRRRSINDGICVLEPNAKTAKTAKNCCLFARFADFALLSRCGLSRQEVGGERLYRGVQRAFQLIVQLLLLADAAQDL